MIKHRPKTTHPASGAAPALAHALPFDGFPYIEQIDPRLSVHELTLRSNAATRRPESVTPRRAPRAFAFVSAAACAFVAALV
ncbi:MAG: hypothetical protein M3268_05050 [Acidobacteriota bacterium]|nr:hypothetical protein [Acidobacteriota bacterium]